MGAPPKFHHHEFQNYCFVHRKLAVPRFFFLLEKKLPWTTTNQSRMEISLSAMFPSDDPLDRPDFNITDYINKRFPNEESLDNLDSELDNIKGMIKKLDEEIINEVSQHSKSSSKGQVALKDAKGSATELFEKIKDIKQKSLAADKMVKQITQDIGDLDTARHNVTLAIRTLTQLNNIVTKMDQIKQMVESRQYTDVPHSLATVNDLLNKFTDFKTVPKIAKLREEVEALKADLQERLFQEFLHEPTTLGVQEKKNLASAAAVIDVLGIRDQFINDFTERQLSNYDMEFSKGSEAARLEHIDKRFTWLMNLLANINSWGIDQHITKNLCLKTRAGLLSVIKATKDDIDPVLLKKLLRKTVSFENELIKMFGGKSAVDMEAAKSRYTAIVSVVFDDFMYISTQQQDNQMNQVFITAMSEETWEPTGKNPVLESSCIIVYNFAKVRQECITMTKGRGFFDLFNLFDKYLKKYAAELSKKLKSAESKFDDPSLQVACVILNTADYCCISSDDIQAKMKEVIDPSYKEKVTLQKTIEEFESVIASSNEFIRKRVMQRLEDAFEDQANMDWANIAAVRDQSPYVSKISKELNNVVPLLMLNITSKKIKGVSELGGEQLILDVKMLKTTLSKILGVGENQARISKRIETLMSNIERLCQVILSDKEMIVSTYKKVYSPTNPTEFIKILDIKGIKKSEQESFLDQLGVGADTPIRLAIRRELEEQESVTGRFGTFLESVSTKGLTAVMTKSVTL